MVQSIASGSGGHLHRRFRRLTNGLGGFYFNSGGGRGRLLYGDWRRRKRLGRFVPPGIEPRTYQQNSHESRERHPQARWRNVAPIGILHDGIELPDWRTRIPARGIVSLNGIAMVSSRQEKWLIGRCERIHS